MTAGNSFGQSSGGLFIPKAKKTAIIIFRGGGRTTIECTRFEPVVNDKNELIGLDYESESKFPFFRFEAVDAIEVVEGR